MKIVKIQMTAAVFLSAMVLMTACRSGPSPDASLSLAGPWKIIAADNDAYRSPGYNDESWDTINLPGTFMPYLAGKEKKLSGIVWLRKTLTLPGDFRRRDLGLIMGRIANADETYFNGERIGSTGRFPPDEHSMWNHPRHYLVPKSVIREGRNIITMRVSYNTYGEILGDMYLTDITSWSESKDLDYFFRIVFSYIIIAMGVPFFIISLFHYLRKRDSQEYLFYFLQLLCGLVIIFDHSTHWNMYGTILNRFKILGFAWVALNVTHPIFLHRIYGLERKKTEVLLWIYFAVVLFIGIFFTTPGRLRVHGLLLITVTTAIGFYNLSCHLYALAVKKPLARLFSFFGIIVILGAIHDGIVYFYKFAFIPAPALFQNMIFYYSAFTLYVGTALVIVTRHVTVQNDIDAVKNNLEKSLSEYSRLYEEISDSRSMARQYIVNTDRAEEKIQKVLAYISKNYRDDISREGMAAMVDIHPDNLGRIFKIVTGMKMGDYINKLRIRDSIDLLASTESTIITIAFSVGFDSLRTFNRAFLKVMKTTPEQYRKMQKIANHPFITLQR